MNTYIIYFFSGSLSSNTYLSELEVDITTGKVYYTKFAEVNKIDNIDNIKWHKTDRIYIAEYKLNIICNGSLEEL